MHHTRYTVVGECPEKQGKRSHKSLFDPARQVHLAFSDPDQFREMAIAWDLELTQIARGHYWSSLDILHTPNIQFSLARHRLGCLIRGRAATGAYSIVLPILQKEPLYFYGVRLEDNLCPVFAPGEETESFCQGKLDFASIVIDRKQLDRMTAMLFDRSFSSLIHQNCLIIPARDQQALVRTVTTTMARLTGSRLNLTKSGSALLEKAVIEQLLQCIQIPGEELRRRIPGRLEAAKRAEYIIRQNLERRPDIKQLSRLVGCSVRALYLGFKERYGISPARYARILALEAVRKELCLLPQDKTIAEIAIRRGFYHLGRFSLQYKDFFGESPSATITRARKQAQMHRPDGKVNRVA